MITKLITLRGACSDVTSVIGNAPKGVASVVGPGTTLSLEGITFIYQGSDPAHVVKIIDSEFDIQDCRFTGGIRAD